MRKIINDDFGCRCRWITKNKKRCSKRVQWLIPFVVSRASWIEAIKTGWPVLKKGMKEPVYSKYGLCHQHGRNRDTLPVKLWGITIGKVKLDAEYEAARKEGDSK